MAPNARESLVPERRCGGNSWNNINNWLMENRKKIVTEQGALEYAVNKKKNVGEFRSQHAGQFGNKKELWQAFLAKQGISCARGPNCMPNCVPNCDNLLRILFVIFLWTV